MKDISDVFVLSNQLSTRKYSINPKKILWEEHLNWFHEVLKNDKSVLYIVYSDNQQFLGQIRYDIVNKSAEVSISIVNELKGKGCSLEILKRSQAMITKEKDVKEIIAIINNENIPSIKLFKKAGYQLIKTKNNFSKFIYRT